MRSKLVVVEGTVIVTVFHVAVVNVVVNIVVTVDKVVESTISES